MQQWFNANQSILLVVIGALVSGFLTPLFAKIPQNTWWLIVLKAILAPLFNVGHYGVKTNTTLVSLVFLLGCASTKTEIVSATLSNGHTYPLVLEVTENTPFGVKLLAEFGATVQQQIELKAAEYRKLYPKATITEMEGKQTRKLN